MINNNLLNGVASMLAGSSYTLVSHLAFGSTSGTLSAADTVTSGEFDRNTLGSKTASLNLVKYVGQRLAGEAGNEYVNVISFVNSGSLYGTGDIQVSFLVSSLIHTTSFDIDAEAWITVNKG